MDRCVKIVAISDIHIGHNKNPAKSIADNIITLFTKYYKDIIDADIIVISGDFWDKLLTMDHNDAIIGLELFKYLYEYAKKIGALLIAMKGTDSHDLDQMKVFSSLGLAGGKYIYIDTVKILNLSKYGINMNVLFVPDNMGSNHLELEEMIRTELNNYNLIKVDVAITHGTFKFQIPVESDQARDEEFYESIVEYIIINGHHHTYTAHGKIVNVGSVDRLKQGEEEDKGIAVITIHPIHGVHIKRLINHNATIFRTYKLDGKDIIKETRFLRTLPDGSWIQLFIKEIPDLSIRKHLIELYPNIHLEFKKLDTDMDNATSNSIDIKKVLASQFEILPNTIVEQLYKKMNGRYDINSIQKVLDMLETI